MSGAAETLLKPLPSARYCALCLVESKLKETPLSGVGGGIQGKAHACEEVRRQTPDLALGRGSSLGAEGVVTGEETFEGNLKR